MPIHPLPQFEADLAEDRKIYEKLKPPTSMVVRFGIMKLVGEYPYNGDAKPGCGSKVVVRTHRGVELAEMLTTTCPNAGCSKSVTRQEMLEYIENSGGRDYPFFNQGRVMRIATLDDINQQAKIDIERPKHVMRAREILGAMEPAIPMKIVDAEPILGGEKITFYFTSEDRVDFRDLVSRLAAEHHTRIELRQVGARDEARLVADYERCGQHCCCKQFLKVLKPISMKSAKIQKATLDPLKISGRCGRLMCCLRYEDESYDDLRKRLPKKKVRLKTPEGWGIVMDTQILTQLVLLRLEHVEKDVAFTVEDLGLVDGKQTPEVQESIGPATPVVNEAAASGAVPGGTGGAGVMGGRGGPGEGSSGGRTREGRTGPRDSRGDRGRSGGRGDTGGPSRTPERGSADRRGGERPAGERSRAESGGPERGVGGGPRDDSSRLAPSARGTGMPDDLTGDEVELGAGGGEGERGGGSDSGGESQGGAESATGGERRRRRRRRRRGGGPRPEGEGPPPTGSPPPSPPPSSGPG